MYLRLCNTPMDLEEFIHRTLTSIYKGVERTNKKLLDTTASVQSREHAPFSIAPRGEGAFIEFDVAVTIGATSKKGGRAGLKVYVAEVGADGEKTDAEETVSHIKFKIAAMEPVQK